MKNIVLAALIVLVLSLAACAPPHPARTEAEIEATVVAKITQTAAAVPTATATETPRPTETPTPTATPTPEPLGARGWICYVGNGYDIWVVRADGSGKRNVTKSSGFQELSPKWSPDGSKIAFIGLTTMNLYVINVDGTNRQQLTSGGNVNYPAWSPDGKWIVFKEGFMSDGKYLSRLWLKSADGTSSWAIYTSEYAIISPVFSPDGKYIYFSSGGITRIGVDGSGATEIASGKDIGLAAGLSVSPDGKKLAFHVMPGVTSGAKSWAEYSDIYTMNTDGTDLQNLTHDEPGPTVTLQPGKNILRFVENPVWTRDGRLVLQSNEMYGGYNTRPFVMNADGSGLELILDLQVSDMDFIQVP